MQNKGFVRLIAILLALVCLFYLSFTFVTNNISKNGNLRLVSNPLTSGLLVYGVVPINPVSSNVYISNENNAELITQLLQYVGNQNNIYNAATEQIKNVRVEATFEGNTVYLDMFYEVALISNLLQTRVSIVKFTGTK